MKLFSTHTQIYKPTQTRMCTQTRRQNKRGRGAEGRILSLFLSRICEATTGTDLIVLSAGRSVRGIATEIMERDVFTTGSYCTFSQSANRRSF